MIAGECVGESWWELLDKVATLGLLIAASHSESTVGKIDDCCPKYFVSCPVITV